MASFISTALFLLLDVTSSIHPAVSQSINLTEPMCYDWGESNKGVVSILEGEAGWLSCPLFSHPSVYNYNSTQNAGHNLFWYHIPEGQDLEQPISYSSRLSKDRERLWLQPAAAEDTGQYICMLRNKSSCSKISMRLKVLRPDQVTRPVDCAPPVPMEATKAVIPLQEGDTLHCPDLQDAMKTSNVPPNVTWQHVGPGNSRCYKVPFWNTDREQQGTSLEVHVMLVHYQGLYFCRVDFQRSGRALSFTRSINVTAIQPSSQPKEPTILHPHEHQVFTVKRDTDAHLVCRALFPVIRENSSWEMWWTVDGKMLNELANSQRFKQNSSVVNDNFGDKTVDSILVIRNIQAEDLKREINCSVRNPKGFDSRRAQLEEDVSLPSVELGCGLGVTLVLMLLLFVVYHVFWLELLLLYRSWFGTDERHTDDKEYDVYISYARNSEEEQFVLSTLRSVLENELGYSVCIFDRDSLPGGNVSDGVLRSMQRSRRLLFVLSPDFLAEKSFSLLECRLGLYLQRGLQATIVAVVYRSIRKLACAEAVQLRQSSVSTVMWRGGRSEPRRSRFWLRLQLALPVRPLALGRRLIDSTSSHSDLAALALQRVQRLQNQNHEGRTSRSQRNRRTSVNQNRRDRKALPRGRGSVRSSVSCRGVGPQHSRSCSRCAGLVGQLEDRWAELTVEVEPQRGSYDRTEAQSYHSVPETDTAPIPPDSAHDDSNAPNHGPSADSALPSGQPDDAGMQIQQQQQIIGSRTSEETSEEKGEELDVKKTVTPPPTKTTAVPLTDELKQQV